MKLGGENQLSLLAGEHEETKTYSKSLFLSSTVQILKNCKKFIPFTVLAFGLKFIKLDGDSAQEVLFL